VSTIKRIKKDRGARVGRYIIASTTAKFNDPEDILSIPCDLAFPCSSYRVCTAALLVMLLYYALS
jgi:hypothetical protein